MEINKNYDLKEIVYFCEDDKIYKTEIFKDIPDYEGKYQVSDLGRFKSLASDKNKKEKILKTQVTLNGYSSVGISHNGIAKTFACHKLVAICFLNHKPCGFKIIINHKNFIRTDNRVSNLEETTPRENTNLKHIKSSSKYVGVSYCKPINKWKSSITYKGKNKYLGVFLNEIDAHNAYQKELKKINMAKNITQ